MPCSVPRGRSLNFWNTWQRSRSTRTPSPRVPGLWQRQLALTWAFQISFANIMWEIESSRSVGNRSGQGAVDPGEPGLCRYPHSGVPTNLGRSRRQNSGPTGRHGRIGRAVWPHWKDWGSGAAKLPVERPRASGKDSIDPNVTKAEATEPRRTNQRGSGRPGRDSAITHGHPNHPSSRTHAFGEQEHCRSWILDSRTPQ